MSKIITNTIGVDLGDRRSEVCVLGKEDVIKQMSVPTTAVGFTREFRDLEHARVVIEVGTHSRWVSELLEGFGHEVVVANPRRVQLIAKSNSKNDRADAELLARLGRADIKLLSPIRHRKRETQADLSLLRSRDTLVAARTCLVNSIRGMVKAAGCRLPSMSAEVFHRKCEPHVPAALLAATKPMLEVLKSIADQIKGLDRQLAEMATQKYPETIVLTQVCGVGPITSLAFVLTLEEPSRFKRSRDVGAFLGLRPKQDQSGTCDKQLRITKAGDVYLRRLLVCCAHYILGPFGKESDLRTWGLRLAERGGKNAKKRAAVAVARKLAVLLHRLWVTGQNYVPVGYVKAA